MSWTPIKDELGIWRTFSEFKKINTHSFEQAAPMILGKLAASQRFREKATVKFHLMQMW